MNTSKRIAWTNRPPFLLSLYNRGKESKYIAIGLFALATALCLWQLGIGSGLFAAIVIFMMVGCLLVFFFPFHYFGLRTILLLYVVCLCFELFF